MLFYNICITMKNILTALKAGFITGDSIHNQHALDSGEEIRVVFCFSTKHEIVFDT